MPANPDDGARLAARILDLIAAAERALIAMIATRLRAGITGDSWEQAKLAEVQLIRQRLIVGTQKLTADVVAEIRSIVLDAYNTGQALAHSDLVSVGLHVTSAPDPINQAARWAQQAIRNVQQAVEQIPDNLVRVYRDAVEAGVTDVLGGSMTRIQATQRVLDELASRGITGYRDAAGRNWSLEAYAEMAVRTGAGHAAVQGHVDSLAASGMDLVIVSDAPRECPLCRPWERQILSIHGGTGARIERSVIGGNAKIVRVKATLEEARLAGFQHPNCRHSVAGYLPGVTIKGAAKADPKLYEASQRQREIERKIREWKRRQVVALDAVADRQAAAKVRDWQAEMRRHLDAHDLQRQRKREQIGTAH